MKFTLLLINTIVVVAAAHLLDPKSIEKKEGNLRSVGDPLLTKTLVIIIGNLRGGEKAWSSLYENYLDPSNADLALMIGKPRAGYTNSSITKRAKYYWEVDEYDDWADAIDLIDGPGWRTSFLAPIREAKEKEPWDEIGNKMGGHNVLGGIKGILGSGAIIFMFRWFLSQKLMEFNLVEKYDRFVITRADHYYSCPYDVRQLDATKVWSPLGEGYKGITDRHLIVSARHVLTALDILPHMISNFNDYADCLLAPCNPELVIARRFEVGGLEIDHFPRTFFTCAAEGDTPSRWLQPGKLLEEGVLQKYPHEYVAARTNCQRL